MRKEKETYYRIKLASQGGLLEKVRGEQVLGGDK